MGLILRWVLRSIPGKWIDHGNFSCQLVLDWSAVTVRSVWEIKFKPTLLTISALPIAGTSLDAARVRVLADIAEVFCTTPSSVTFYNRLGFSAHARITVKGPAFSAGWSSLGLRDALGNEQPTIALIVRGAGLPKNRQWTATDFKAKNTAALELDVFVKAVPNLTVIDEGAVTRVVAVSGHARVGASTKAA